MPSHAAQDSYRGLEVITTALISGIQHAR